MTDKTINDLTATTAVASGDLFELENTSNNSRKVTAANLAKGLQALSFRGALVRKSADQTAADYATALVTMSFNSEDYDTDTFHDTVTNNSRLTIPSGVNWVRLMAQISISNFTADNWVFMRLKKGGSATGYIAMTHASTTNPRFQFVSPPLAVSATEYFELEFQVEADASITVVALETYFSIEVLG